MLAAVDVRGGAPGTINTDALRAGGLITRVNGVVLSGGSVFGLEAATGLIGWLAARGRGFAEWGPCLPIVTGAILFDLINGGDKDWGDQAPYRALAHAAADGASREVVLGNVGAGLGAMAGTLKGGLGSASALDQATGITVAALVAVNPVGSVTMPGSPTMWAWHLEQAGELGGQRAPQDATGHAFETKRGIGMNTTIGVVATDAVTRPWRPAAAGRYGPGRLRLRDPPDPHAVRRRHRLRPGDRHRAIAGEARRAGPPGHDRRRRRGARGDARRVRGGNTR